ncbi:hypothetical protein Scep_002426 [Stephania cephalantha]|uniref:Myb/SANT-like domain-containing protein n=1 Tax=Stephania cephalantha TaxID=152367 RepID=A0AAP0LCP3_9MAGN
MLFKVLGRACVRWTIDQDTALVASLVDLMNKGGRKLNSGTFKGGIQHELERLMKEKLGNNFQIKAHPHIDSKACGLRTKYFALAEMQGPRCSGFGWNDINKSITCDDDVWNNWVQSHPTTVGLRNKPFPFFDELDYVYRKDRATGACAENPANAESNPVTPISARTTQPTESSGNGKRKRNEVIDVVQDLATQVTNAVEIMSTCGEHIRKLAKCFQHGSDCADRRMIVHQEVPKIDGLSQEEVIKAGRKIALDPLEIDYFFSLQEEFKKFYVLSLLLD